jgi:hypothetical protein
MKVINLKWLKSYCQSINSTIRFEFPVKEMESTSRVSHAHITDGRMCGLHQWRYFGHSGRENNFLWGCWESWSVNFYRDYSGSRCWLHKMQNFKNLYTNFLTSVTSSFSSSSIFERANSHSTQRVESFATLLLILFLCFKGNCGISFVTEKENQLQFTWTKNKMCVNR